VKLYSDGCEISISIVAFYLNNVSQGLTISWIALVESVNISDLHKHLRGYDILSSKSTNASANELCPSESLISLKLLMPYVDDLDFNFHSDRI